MVGKIILAVGAVSVVAGGVGGFLTGFQSPVYALVPVGLLLLMVGMVQSLNTSD
ncbi:hypothetical protein [Thiohalorhabdus methylotrophus]|uniref:Uncharacterized protein n=1 Tax=Thiohalorhabdus methylotrophus TaxID=3242694 RepID=A0ABV4TQU4_9GAMM